MKLKRVHAGLYRYGDYLICNMGYYPPDQHVVWEAKRVVDDGEGVAHGFSLRECVAELKMSMENQMENTNEEICHRDYKGT